MKVGVISISILSAALLSMATAVQAEKHDGKAEGIQNAIEQHDRNMAKYRENHPDKDMPKGLIHSREVLERVQAGERPERPEVATRPDRPERVARPDRPERVAKVDRPAKIDRPNRSRR